MIPRWSGLCPSSGSAERCVCCRQPVSRCFRALWRRCRAASLSDSVCQSDPPTSTLHVYIAPRRKRYTDSLLFGGCIEFLLLITKTIHLKTKFDYKTLFPISGPRKCRTSVLSKGASCTKSHWGGRSCSVPWEDGGKLIFVLSQAMHSRNKSATQPAAPGMSLGKQGHPSTSSRFHRHGSSQWLRPWIITF